MIHLFFLRIIWPTLLCLSVTQSVAVPESMMASTRPQFKFPLNKMKVPTLYRLSEDTALGVRKKLYNFSTEFAETLSSHLINETEIKIVQGKVAEESKQLLDKLEYEMGALQYRNKLCNILQPWAAVLLGQPVHPEVENYMADLMQEIIDSFEAFIGKLQEQAIYQMRSENKKLCDKVSKDASQILNLTKVEVPSELDKIFQTGPNMVPMEALQFTEIQKHIENDVISAAVKFAWDENKVYPLFNRSSGLKSILEQLSSQAPSNSKQVEFFATMFEGYKVQINKLQRELSTVHFIDSPEVTNIVPEGTILTLSDKNLGPVLLPIDWYIKEYDVQSVKGSHVVTGLSADQCIHLLKKNINDFRSALVPEEKIFLRKYFSHSSPDMKVGVMKIIPKIHKLSSFDNQSWKNLPSRPIRGAENCPVNPYSKALCEILQEMHSTLKVIMTNNGTGFPLIYGCDEYSDIIQQVEYDRSTWSKKTLISGDFSDAYTKSSLHDLELSIRKLGAVSSWPEPKISLATKLAGLVFDNCFFETPSGILRQTQGFPMGGHSSREGLDNILLSREIDLLDSPIRRRLLSYNRMVDDISLVLDGPFQNVRVLLDKMAHVYPDSMPLNIQISFGYSHYLDSHVYKLLQSSPVNRLTTSLAYKPLAKFDFVPFSSNIAPVYKGKYDIKTKKITSFPF